VKKRIRVPPVRFKSNSSEVCRRGFSLESTPIRLITTAKLDRLYRLRRYQTLPRAILRTTMDSRSERRLGEPAKMIGLYRKLQETRNTFRRRITHARTRVTRVAKRRHKALLVSPRQTGNKPRSRGQMLLARNYRTTSIPSYFSRLSALSHPIWMPNDHYRRECGTIDPRKARFLRSIKKPFFLLFIRHSNAIRIDLVLHLSNRGNIRSNCVQSSFRITLIYRCWEMNSLIFFY